MTQPQSARSATLNLLGRRAYSAMQLKRKLAERGYSADEAESALQFVTEQGWLNDEVYAEQLIRSRISAGYGPAYIREYLKGKGIEAQLTAQLLAQEHWKWWEAIEKAYHKKYRSFPEDWAQQRKCSAYLYRRGFTADLIRELLDTLTH